MDPDLKTYQQWMREGRSIIKGQTAAQYLISPYRTSGRALFRRDQTQLALEPDVDEVEGWTEIVSTEEWAILKADAREIARGPKVKVRTPPDGSPGVDVWCGPDAIVIDWLKAAGYRYSPKTRYWHHPNKDVVDVADAFAGAEIDGKRVRVTRAYAAGEAPVI